MTTNSYLIEKISEGSSFIQYRLLVDTDSHSWFGGRIYYIGIAHHHVIISDKFAWNKQ